MNAATAKKLRETRKAQDRALMADPERAKRIIYEVEKRRQRGIREELAASA